MKKFILVSMALLLAVGVSAKRYPALTLSDLPTVSQNFIINNFGASSVKQVKQNSIKYEVELRNGTEVQFYKDGSFKQVESEKHQALPVSVLNVLPSNVKTYVSSKFGNWRLTEVEVKYSGKIEVELEKGKYDAELEFSKTGQVLKVDIDD